MQTQSPAQPSPRRALSTLPANVKKPSTLAQGDEWERAKPLLSMTSPEKRALLARRLSRPLEQGGNGLKRKFDQTVDLAVGVPLHEAPLAPVAPVVVMEEVVDEDGWGRDAMDTEPPAMTTATTRPAFSSEDSALTQASFSSLINYDPPSQPEAQPEAAEPEAVASVEEAAPVSSTSPTSTNADTPAEAASATPSATAEVEASNPTIKPLTELLRLRLQVAMYKVQTNQIRLPLSKVQLPRHHTPRLPVVAGFVSPQLSPVTNGFEHVERRELLPAPILEPSRAPEARMGGTQRSPVATSFAATRDGWRFLRSDDSEDSHGSLECEMGPDDQDPQQEQQQQQSRGHGHSASVARSSMAGEDEDEAVSSLMSLRSSGTPVVSPA